jgi:hypothetical protein
LREIAVRAFPVRERQIDIWFTKTRPMRRGEERERRREKEREGREEEREKEERRRAYLVDKKRTMSPTSKERNDILARGSGNGRSDRRVVLEREGDSDSYEDE